MAFEFVTTIPVRYRDLDPFDHVNNAVYVTYLEQARVEYLQAVLDLHLSDVNIVMAGLELDYRSPVTFDESVAVAVRTTDLGRSSIRMAYEVRADGNVAATAETTIVYVGDGDRSTPLPDAWREAIESYEPAL